MATCSAKCGFSNADSGVAVGRNLRARLIDRAHALETERRAKARMNRSHHELGAATHFASELVDAPSIALVQAALVHVFPERSPRLSASLGKVREKKRISLVHRLMLDRGHLYQSRTAPRS